MLGERRSRISTRSETRPSELLDGDLELQAAAVTGSAASVSENALFATSDGLEAVLEFETLAGTTIEGDADEQLSVDLFAGDFFTPDGAIVDFVQSNSIMALQRQTASTEAMIGAGTDNESAALRLAGGDVTNGAAAELNDNRVEARARGIFAESRARVEAGTDIVQVDGLFDSSATSIVAAQQVGDAFAGGSAVSAVIEGLTLEAALGILDGAAASVSGNSTSATAQGAEAAAEINMAADGEISGDGDGQVSLEIERALSLLNANSAADATGLTLQVSATEISARIEPGINNFFFPDEFPSARLSISGPAGSTDPISAAVDANEFRAIARNLSSNSFTNLAAKTRLDKANAAIITVQDIGRDFVSTDTLAIGEGVSALISASDIFDGTASANGNLFEASADGAVSQASLSISAADIVSTFGIGTQSISVPFGGPQIDASSADPAFIVGLAQMRDGAVQASLSDGDIGFQSGRLGVAVAMGGAASGVVTLDENELLAAGRGLAAENFLSLEAANGIDGAGASILAVQSAPRGSGAVDALINPASIAGIDNAGISFEARAGFAGPISVSSNDVRAEASGNILNNQQTVSSTGSILVGTETIATPGAAPTFADAGFAIASLQTLSDPISGDIRNLDIEAVVSGGALAGNVSLRGNKIDALATGNAARNLLELSAGGALNASGGVLTEQVAENGASILARATGSGDSGRIGLNAQDFTGAAQIENNRVIARALQNVSDNSVSLAGASLRAADGGAILLTGDTRADFVALNRQQGAGSIQGVIEDVEISATLSGGGGSGPPDVSGSVEVKENFVVATAAGNQSNNDFRVEADGQARGDFAFNGRQTLDSSISARLSNVSVGIDAGANDSASGTYSVRGNVIGAVGRGNASTTGLRAGP